MARHHVAAVVLVVVLASCGGDGPSEPSPLAPPRPPAVVLAEGKHFGFVTAIDLANTQLMFDDADLLGGLDARRAAERGDGVVTRGGSYVDNRDRRAVRVNVSKDLEVRLLTPCCELHQVSIDQWVDGFDGDERTFYGTSKSHYELTVVDREVVTVDEVVVR